MQEGALRCEVVADLATARGEWDRLALRSGNVFATWEWADAWWRQHGRDRPLFVVVCRDGAGEAVGILPLYLASRRPLAVIRQIGHGAGDELGPVCAPEDRAALATATRGALDSLGVRWDVLVVEGLPIDDAWSAFDGGERLSCIPSPVLEVRGMSWEEFMAARSRNFRRHVRRAERELGERGLVFRLAEDPERLPADLDALVRLHDARWGKQSSGVFTGPDGRLLREFAATALERGWLRLWFLELEGRPVAARLGFRFGDVKSGYQSGRDPEVRSVGFLLQVHAIRAAIEEGVTEYRFLRGGEAYKDRFANADRGLETIVLTKGLLGRSALVARRLSLAVQSRRGPRPWKEKDAVAQRAG
jgi:CelD/BcsL family acetyltransferase involved in cellulose biosynthesis